ENSAAFWRETSLLLRTAELWMCSASISRDTPSAPNSFTFLPMADNRHLTQPLISSVFPAEQRNSPFGTTPRARCIGRLRTKFRPNTAERLHPSEAAIL